ncbi:STAS domain-containing protein [Planosporangium flavigriseum]|uniref:Anti-sigma factor antagonist n=1 Tax=Planosporangium flavigriseum TaxID=373681 RepID=A0A8J3LRL9_9ACTN|nr:STAS domain-containing protein [Planosporangium flavigriseum]NJC63362.1 STAS domain-containing protein [Planosporangium flavigriseum]GIG75343.1 hypothetical protein Pfl04_37470 [Planosporangium flavigriseum]
MKLAYVVDRSNGETTIVLAGEVDETTNDQLRHVLFDAVSERPKRLTVDLRGLIFLDSGGIGTLVAVRRAAIERRCRFRVTRPQGQVLRVLTVAGVLTALTAADSAREAGGGIGAASGI